MDAVALETLLSYDADLAGMRVKRTRLLTVRQGVSKSVVEEFEHEDHVNRPYVINDYHWAFVDRWFDGEVPGSIVEQQLAHVFRRTDGCFLAE